MSTKPSREPTKRELAYNDAASRWLRATREHHQEMKQKDMATRAGIDPSILSRAETGSSVPKNLDAIIDAVAGAVGMTPDQARLEIIRLMFPEADLAAGAEALADEAQKPHRHRRTN